MRYQTDIISDPAHYLQFMRMHPHSHEQKRLLNEADTLAKIIRECPEFFTHEQRNEPWEIRKCVRRMRRKQYNEMFGHKYEFSGLLADDEDPVRLECK